jgi:hypothetical protein
VRIANLHIVAGNVTTVVRNRAAKWYRHYFSRARRVAKLSAEQAKNTRTRLRQAADHGRDEIEHARADAVRSARYWTRLKEQLLEPLAHDVAIKRELRTVAAGDGPRHRRPLVV